jgi:hypothetical protein
MKRIALLQLFLVITASAFSQSEDNEIIRIQKKRELATCEVILYPNPSTDRILIAAPQGASCQIYSVQGTYVGTWILGEEELEVTDLGSGNYVALISNAGSTVRRNFVIL